MKQTYGAAELAASFRTVRNNTVKIAEEIPEEQYGFQPAPGTRTVAQLLAHIGATPRIWMDIAQKELTTLEGYDFFTVFQGIRAEEEKTRTKSELIQFLQQEGEAFASLLAGLSDEFLAVQIKQPGADVTKSRLESLMSAKEHEMHHRAQLMLIERLIGITPHMTRAMQERIAQMQAAAKQTSAN
jgi:uncharacterized damage-inducible protein DinB